MTSSDTGAIRNGNADHGFLFRDDIARTPPPQTDPRAEAARILNETQIGSGANAAHRIEFIEAKLDTIGKTDPALAGLVRAEVVKGLSVTDQAALLRNEQSVTGVGSLSGGKPSSDWLNYLKAESANPDLPAFLKANAGKYGDYAAVGQSVVASAKERGAYFDVERKVLPGLEARIGDPNIAKLAAPLQAYVADQKAAANRASNEVVTTAIIAPAGAAAIGVAAPAAAGAAFAQGSLLYYGAAASIGGTGNMILGEATHAMTSDQSITTGERLGNLVSGAVFGGQFVIKGLKPIANDIVIGGFGSALGDGVQQLDEKGISNYDLAQGGASALIGGVAGGVGGRIGDTAIPRITSGRGNWDATYRSVQTRIANGNASQMSPGVAIRGGGASQANQLWSNLTTAGVQVLIAPQVADAAPKK